MSAPTRRIELIAARLETFTRERCPIVVGIDGCGGSGKSTLADALRSTLGARSISCSIVHGDDFYRPSADRDRASEREHGSSFDLERLDAEVLAPLANGRPASYRRYDWSSDTLAERVVVPADGVILVEGVYVTRSDIASRYAMTVWVDCPGWLRLERGVARDGEAGRSLWTDVWIPAEDRYVAGERPRARADFVVRGWELSSDERPK